MQGTPEASLGVVPSAHNTAVGTVVYSRFEHWCKSIISAASKYDMLLLNIASEYVVMLLDWWSS